MGGKAVMALTALAPERINGLVVIDVAPVDYDVRRHDEIFAAINAVTEAGVATRQQAAPSCVSILMKKACAVPAEVVC
jgi:esterase